MLTLPESSSDDLPYDYLFQYILVWGRSPSLQKEQPNLVDNNYDLDEAVELYQKCYPIKETDKDAIRVLKYICMGHNAPAHLKEKFNV